MARRTGFPLLTVMLAVGQTWSITGGMAPPTPERPRHVVTMNLCADELVLRLADREQVAAVTYLAHDPRGSTVEREATGIAVTRGLSEEIVALRPDLVVASAFTTRTTVGLLKRVGFPLLELGVPNDFDGFGRRSGPSPRRSDMRRAARPWWRPSMRALPRWCRRPSPCGPSLYVRMPSRWLQAASETR